MKKFIIASTCTLMLSLIGAFGSYQNSLNFDQQLNTKTSNTEAIEDQQNLPSDNQTNVADIVAGNTDMKINTISLKENNNQETNNTLTSANTIPEKAVLSACINKKIIYKSVNLSKCKSVQDVIKTLHQNGYTKVTKKNIYTNKSLKNVLLMIKQNATYNKENNATNTPAKAPVTKTTSNQGATPTTVTTSSKTSGISNYATEVRRLVNVERAKAGLSALATNTPLTSAANLRAKETVQSFSHTRLDGTGFSTVLKEYGIKYNSAGENIAYGQKTPKEVVTAWMNSAGHRANIMNTNYGKIGIGVYQSKGVIYWTQEFTN